jgi:hypothetical protein
MFKHEFYIRGNNTKCLFWLIRHGYEVESFEYTDPTTEKPSGRYYYVQNKDGAWKSAEDFSAFLAEHNFRFKDYPGGKKLPKFLGFKSYSDYVRAKSHDWSNAYVTYDIDAELKKLLGYIV